MLRKPNYYDNARAMEMGTSDRIPAGWYPAVIMAVTQGTTPKGSEYLEFSFDIIDGEYARYYQKDFTSQTPYNGEKKWRGTLKYFLSEKAIGMLKGAMQAVEESNPGYQWDWDETKVKGKKVGLGIRDEEYEANDGSIKISTRPYAFCAIQKVLSGEMPVPKPKPLNKPGSMAGASSGGYAAPNLTPPGYQSPAPTSAPNWEPLTDSDELPF